MYDTASEALATYKNSLTDRVGELHDTLSVLREKTQDALAELSELNTLLAATPEVEIKEQAPEEQTHDYF